MKTTLDLPDALVKQVKLRALRDGRKLKDAVADFAVGDPEKVEQILLNLLSNAIKFTEKGDMIEVSVDCEDDWVIARVRDTGSGIAPDKIDAVFEPFVQLNRTKTSGNGGTGLGLSISRDLARLMSGDLTLTSDPGTGSTFSLRLPRAAAT